MITLRFATAEDIPVILEWGQEMFKLNPAYSSFRYDSRMAKEAILRLLESPREETVCLVASNDTGPVGCLLGASGGLPFTGDKIATEFMFYVTTGNARAGKSLIDAYTYWAKLIGCSHVSLGIFEADQKQTYFTRRGYHRGENLYFKDIRPDGLIKGIN